MTDKSLPRPESLLVGDGVAPVLVVEAGVACTPDRTEVGPVEVVVAEFSGPPGWVVSVASAILVVVPPVIDAGAEACTTCAAASLYVVTFLPAGGLTTPTIPLWQCEPREQ